MPPKADDTDMRAAWPLVVLSTAALAAAAPAAHAAPRTTQVTSPASPAYFLDDAALTGPGDNRLTVTGTSEGASPGDRVDLRCYSTFTPEQPYVVVQEGVRIARDGTFALPDAEHPTPPPLSRVADEHCVLRAVPAGTSPTALGAFAGPELLTGSDHRVGLTDAGPNTGRLFDHFLSFPGRDGYFDYASLGACGIVYARPSAVGTVGYGRASPFDCAAYPWWRGDGTTPGLEVDGAIAYDAFGRAKLDDGRGRALPGFGPMAVDERRFDPAGTSGLRETQVLQRCLGDGGAPVSAITGAGCRAFADTGVRVVRTIRQDAGGARSTITDRYESADGAPHRLRLLYEYDQFQAGDGTAPAGYRFPGEPGFGTFQQYDQVGPFAASSGIVEIQTDATLPEGSLGNPLGAIAFSALPDSVSFYGNDGFFAAWSRTIPAEGAVELTQTFVQGRRQAEVTAAAHAAQDAFAGPEISLSPRSGARVAAAAEVVDGRASDNVALATVTVNGVPVTPGPDGAFSAPVKLVPGVNTISARAADAGGRSAEARIELVYAPRARRCRVPKVRQKPLATARRLLVRAGCRAGKVTAKRARRTRPGRVMDQGTRPGRLVRAGTRISLEVARKAKPHRRSARRR
jgi:hypothetical protein